MKQSLNNAKDATFITIQAKPGKEGELSALLIAGAKIIAETEEKTLFWTALKISFDTFIIFDTFTDESGRSEHFKGQVACLLQEKAHDLIVGGWEQGVVANIQNASVLATA